MPIIKSAKKRVRQAAVRQKRNYAVRREMKAAVKNIFELIKNKKMDEAAKALPGVYKVLDTAAKKKIIHGNKAARNKSSIARALAAK